MNTNANITRVRQWDLLEITLTRRGNPSAKENPYAKKLMGIFIGPDNHTLTIPGFWDGGNTWRIRFAPPTPGTWNYIISRDFALDGEEEGCFECVTPASSDIEANPNLRGFLRCSKNGRYFTYADGTPFYWMGECLWDANGRMSLDSEFLPYIADRKAKEFSVIQICVGIRFYILPDTDDEQFSVNEGGELYESDMAQGDYTRINPKNLQYFDKRIQAIIDAGMVPAILIGWGDIYNTMPLGDLKTFWNYLIARYQAHNVIWILSGEYGYVDNKEILREVGQFVRRIDQSRHLITLHPGPPWPSSTSMDFYGEPWLDFNMQQVVSLTDLIHRFMLIDYNLPVPLPVVMGETGYEGHRGTREEVRRMAWYSCMAGGFYSYGANSIAFNFDKRNENVSLGKSYSWQEALRFGGSHDMRRIVRFFTSLEWWTLTPRQDLVDSGYCLASANLYIVYLASPGTVSFDISALQGTPAIAWYDPSTGEYEDCGSVNDGQEHSFQSPFEGDGVLVVKGFGN